MYDLTVAVTKNFTFSTIAGSDISHGYRRRSIEVFLARELLNNTKN
jgi:hypothetical protein